MALPSLQFRKGGSSPFFRCLKQESPDRPPFSLRKADWAKSLELGAAAVSGVQMIYELVNDLWIAPRLKPVHNPQSGGSDRIQELLLSPWPNLFFIRLFSKCGNLRGRNKGESGPR